MNNQNETNFTIPTDTFKALRLVLKRTLPHGQYDDRMTQHQKNTLLTLVETFEALHQSYVDQRFAKATTESLRSILERETP